MVRYLGPNTQPIWAVKSFEYRRMTIEPIRIDFILICELSAKLIVIIYLNIHGG